ncbi:pro-adrenomedullin [Halichoeres trimaculatus]|uniref:pro-adrenomedullin n=1 Tax=Halichoeres trimaculatus TaxID=147232 RepID=UPI003D9DD01A
MKLALQTVICCCVFTTTVLPLVKGASEELNSSLKKRLRVLLHSRMKRDLHDGLVTLDDLCAEILAGQQQGDIENVSPSPSTGLDNRSRRSASSRSAGCVLVTCSYHDLLFKLHQLTNRQKEATAPVKKISSQGYGKRRRRSLLDVASKKRGQNQGYVASHRAHRLGSKRTVA